MCKSIIILMVGCFTVFGCSVSPTFYKRNKPTFNILQYFCGKTEGYGIFFDASDKATVRFKVSAIGNCESPGVLKLQEDIAFEDGAAEHRMIEVYRIYNNKMTIVGNDLEHGGKGEQSGNVANFKYTRVIKKGLSSSGFEVNDWMYMIDKNQMFNRMELKKFYWFDAGEITIIWRKA